MIFDRIENRRIYENLHVGFSSAFDFIEKAVSEGLGVGRYDIDGDRVYAMVQEYETREDWALFEAHRRYIDIQFIVSGSEYMECTDICNCKDHTPYDVEKDAGFYTLCGLKRGIEMLDGDFVIFYPHDAHRPTLRLGECKQVKKVVVKIAV